MGTPRGCATIREKSYGQVEKIRKMSILILILVFDFCCLVSDVQSLDTSQCNGPLGMESYQIPDSDLTASSSFDASNVGPQSGRVRVEKQGGAWCPKNAVTSEASEWLQIDLHTSHVIQAVEVQGRFGNGVGMEFTEFIGISYWRSEVNKWIRYRDLNGSEILKGNINTYLPEKSVLDPPIIASKLRIMPYSNYKRTVCLRVEIWGCELRGGLVSYSMPQGSARAEGWELYDHTYDGTWDGHYLSSGLGALFDGRVATTNLKDDFYKHDRGKGWVGWKNETRNSSDPLEIVFHFDSIREFNALHIHASNQFSEGVQVFAEVRIYVGTYRDPITVKMKDDLIFEDSKNITIKLYNRIGKYLKLQLYWANAWILISEISFDSVLAMGNFTAEHDAIGTTGITTTTIISSTTTVTTTLQPPSDTYKTKRNESQQQHVVVHQVHQIPEDISVGASSRVTDGWSVSSVAIVATAVLSSFIAIVVVLVIIFTAIVVRNKLITLVKLPGSSQSSLHYGGASVSVVNDGLGPSVEYTTSSDDSPAQNLIKSTQISIGTVATQDYHEPTMTTTNFSSFKGSTTTSTSTFRPRRDSFCNGENNMTKFCSYSLANSTPSHITDSCNEYEYVLPTEFGKLLPHQFDSPNRVMPPESCQQTLGRNRAIHLRFRELGLPEISRHRLNILRNLGEGTFGTVFVGELEKCGPADRRLVVVKRMLRNASEKDKLDFIEEVRLLSAIGSDPNVTQVLGVSSEEEPFGVILEFLEMGDLCQFLRQNDNSHPAYTEKLSLSDLLYMAGQIASGMKYFESKNIVHRDLAARNCLVGRGLMIKIGFFASEIDIYQSDYCRLPHNGKTPFPIRFMAWESLFLGKYSTKSDVWSFGITLWQLLTFCRHSPYHALTNQEVLQNLEHLTVDEEADFFEFLEKPPNCPREIYQLICDTVCRIDDDRPTFWELQTRIHSFSRKNTHFTPHLNTGFGAEMISRELPAYIEAHTHAQQYIV